MKRALLLILTVTGLTIAVQAQTLTYQTLEGERVKLADTVKRNRITVVNFWATWCPPCRREIPDLVALQRQYSDQGIEVLGLTIEDQSDFQRINRFIDSRKINYQVGFGSMGLYSAINHSWPRRGGIPRTLILDNQGRVLADVLGNPGDIKDWAERYIKPVLRRRQ